MRPGIDPKVDYAFKRLFGREQNAALLIHLLNAILPTAPGGPISTVELLNPFNDKDAWDDKLSILDIKARDQHGRQFNVEMQMLPDLYLPQRLTYYLTRFHQGQLHEAEDYAALRPTFAVCFLNHVSWPQVSDHHLTFDLREQRHGFAFTSDLALHMLELPKFTKAAEHLTGPLDVWLYFLRHAETLDTEALPPSLQTPQVQRALGELTMLTQSDLERERYEARLKWQRDERSRLTSAREEGRREEVLKRIHLCQRLLRQPLTPAEEVLALPPEAAQRLAEMLEQQVLVRAGGGGS